LTDITRHGISKIKVNFKAKDSEHLAIGDTIKTRVKLFPIGSSLLPGGYDFGIYMYLNEVEASGYALGAPKIITKEQVQDLGYYYTKIQNIRKVIYHKLIEVLGKYEGNFVSAILIGETKAIDPQMAKNMRNSGIAHILSVSGLHLSLVAMIFFIVSRFLLNCSNYLSYKINIKIVAGIISIFGSFGYLLLSGSNIAATRAFIMTLIVILAIIFERSAYPLRSVMIAGMLILLMTPEYIMHPSFQLSFSAVLCLISGYEIYIRNQQIFGNSKGIFGQVKLYVFTNIYSSFLASIVTAPFVIYHFYKFASYSILMNLLAVPLMSFFMMPLAIIALLLMPFGLSELPLEMLGFFVKIVTDSAAWIVTLPYAVINTGYITESSMLLFTFGFFWICLWQTSWRYFGLMIMLGGTIMMYFSPKADFIYDHRTHAISIKNNNNVNMYSKGKISNFTKEYLLTWYGVSESREFIYENGFEDNIFEFPGKFGLLKVSLNYSRCMDADVQIIISSSLVCDNHELVIPYNDVTESGVVLVFCEKNGCYITLGQRPIWKVIKKGL
jgi:competence protein ComEC